MTVKIPPQDLEAELAILGGLLIDNSKYVTVESIISSRDFYKTANRKIYESMGELSMLGEPIDILSLSDVLKKNKALDNVGGAAYVAGLADGVATAANIAYHCKIVKEKAVARSIIATAISLKDSIDAGDDVADVLEVMKESVLNINYSKNTVPVYTMKEVIKKAFSQIETAHEGGSSIVGVPYGFVKLDKTTSGALPGDLIVIAGRPGMGKSLFVGEIIYNAADLGYPAALFSAEMMMEQYGKRMLSSRGKVKHTRTRTGKMVDTDWAKLTQAAGSLSEKDIFVVDKGGLTLNEIITTAETLKLKHGLKAMAVDYLQLVKVKNLKGRSREQEVSLVSYEMKQLAKRLEIPVFLLSQLNREVEKRPDKRPQISDLRESGSIEQDADVILLLYRPAEYFNDGDIGKLYGGWGDRKPTTLDNLMECIIGKGRDVGTGTVFLKSELQYQSITDFNPMGF